MPNIPPFFLSLLWTGVGLVICECMCTLIHTSIQSITLAEIERFHPYHEHTSQRLLFFYKNRIIPTVSLDTFKYSIQIYIIIIAAPLIQQNDLTAHLIQVFFFIICYIVVGKIIPYATGNRLRVPLAFIFAYPLAFLSWLLTPVTKPLILISKYIDKPHDFNPKQIISDIQQLAHAAAAEQVISIQQAHLVMRSVELSEISAIDIMVKRDDIKAISDTLSLNKALIDAHLHHHTRFPLIHENDIDQIIGYVNFKDIIGALRVNPSDPTLNGIRRPIEFVPDTTSLPELFQKLTRGYHHIVIVRSSQTHATLGMITLEDLMETLIGDLEDEYDAPPSFIIPLGENRFCAGGGTPFSHLRKKIDLQFPDWDLTINDWLSGTIKEAVTDQYSIDYLGYSFTVKKVARGHVFDVFIDRLAPLQEN